VPHGRDDARVLIPMRYVSTRGGAEPVPFTAALLAGLAPDGGLYVPEERPAPVVASPSFAETTARVAAAFTDDIDPTVLAGAASAAAASFSHPATTPLVQTGPAAWIMELHHGPTLAFKDVAMQLLGRLFERVLSESGERITIIGATSGDTGGAAIEALKGRSRIDVVMLHPEGRISDVQRRFMTTVEADNIANVAIDGSFDDCQRIVKALLGDPALREEAGLSAVNSINWARIMAQSVYYLQACAALAGDVVNFSVPTGNFGDALAGWVAKRLGAKVGRIVVATNENDILHRALKAGRYEPGAAKPTISPAMDIQVASNFERILFEALDRDPVETRMLMESLKTKGGFDIPAPALEGLRADFVSARVDRAGTEDEMRRALAETGHLVCPHTAVGLAAARRLGPELEGGPLVALATAHAAKFPEVVEAATGVRPPLPERYADLYERNERFARLPADEGAVADYVRARAAR